MAGKVKVTKDSISGSKKKPVSRLQVRTNSLLPLKDILSRKKEKDVITIRGRKTADGLPRNPSKPRKKL
tara:strand:- start:11052 stop:11258 length:207 start_codon:yes stop_codon:yes gene_type:complete